MATKSVMKHITIAVNELPTPEVIPAPAADTIEGIFAAVMRGMFPTPNVVLAPAALTIAAASVDP